VSRHAGPKAPPLADRNGGATPLTGDEQFRLLVSGVKEYAIFMLDPSGRVATWNAGAEQLKGYSTDEIVGKEFSIFYTPEDLARELPRRLLAIAETEGRVSDEGFRVRKNGTLFWADVVITALRDDEGRLRGFGKVTRDLTVRKAAEEELRRSEDRVRLMIGSIGDYAIYLLDADGRVATWNRGAELIKGYRENEIVGTHFAAFFSPEDRAAGKPAIELTQAVAEGRFEEEAWRLRKDGSRFWANVILSPVRDAGGELIGFVKVTRDLTERRKTEEERRRLAQAQEAVRLREEFLTIASHELRTPLTALRLQLDAALAATAAVDAKVANKIERAAHASRRLAGLVEMLLDASRIATGGIELSLASFDLAEATTDTIEAFRDAATRARCELLLEVDAPGGALAGTWDRLRVEQVLMNLLGNAIKYGAGKPVSVRLSRDGDMVVVQVRDGGPGIPEAEIHRIFDRFERAVSTRHYGGLGLGLYIVRRLAEAHGGSVTVENPPDGGARFTVRLPLAPPAPTR
jgi:PAS domain S-box-containing protein